MPSLVLGVDPTLGLQRQPAPPADQPHSQNGIYPTPVVTQPTWFIDPINGSDGNSGDVAARALQTDAERQRRWGAVNQVTLPISVTYTSSPPATDPVNFNALIANGAGLLIQGQRTTVATGSFTAVTVQVPGTQTPWSVTDAALPGGFAAHVGRIIRITSGANAGNYARIVKDLGGGAARISPFGHFVQQIFNFFVGVTPLVGDTYEIVTLPNLPIGNVNFNLLSNIGITQAAIPKNAVQFDSVQLTGNLTGVIAGTFCPILVSQSIVTSMLVASDFLFVGGGGFDNSIVRGPSFADLIGIGSIGGVVSTGTQGSLQIEGDSIFQNAQVGCDGGTITVISAACFDQAVADAAFVCAGPGPSAVRVTTRLWGTNNAGHGVRVTSGHFLEYVAQPTVNTGLGAGREALIGGTDTLWAGVPFINPANNAGIFVSQ